MRTLLLRFVLSAVVLAALLASERPLPGADPAAPRTDALGDALPAGAVARIGTNRFRSELHAGGVALSTDGKLLAVSTAKAIRLLDTTTGTEVRKLDVGALRARGGAIQFSPDGKFLALSGNGEVDVIDASKGTPVIRIMPLGQNKGGQIAVSFSADGKLMAVGGSGLGRGKPSVAVWDVAAKKSLRTIAVTHDGYVQTALSPDGKVVVTWGSTRAGRAESSFLQVWDVATGKEVQTLKLEGLSTTQVVFSPDGKHLLVAAEEPSTLSIWDVETGKRLRRFAGRRGTGTVLGYSPDGKFLFAGDSDGVLQTWNDATGERVGQCQGPPSDCFAIACFGIACLGGEKVLVASRSYQAVSLWDAPSGRGRIAAMGHVVEVQGLAFSRDGKSLLSAGSDGVRSWQMPTGKQLRRVEVPPIVVTDVSNGEAICRLSQDGRHVIWAFDHDPDIRVIETASGQEIISLPGRVDHRGLTAAFAPGTNMVAVLDATFSVNERGHAFALWDLGTGQERGSIKIPSDNLERCTVAFAPGGKVLAYSPVDIGGRGEGGHTILWDVANDKEIATVASAPAAEALAFSPDASLLAASSADGAIHLCDAHTGREIRTLPGEKQRMATALTFSPDGRTLAAISTGLRGDDAVSKVVLWELVSGKVRAEFSGHRGAVTSLAFSPDGRTLATGGADTTILLWDLTGSSELAGRIKAKPTADELAKLWADLDSADAAKAQPRPSRGRRGPRRGADPLAERAEAGRRQTAGREGGREADCRSRRRVL